MVNPSDILPASVLAPLTRKSDWRGVALVVHCWAVIFAAMAFFAWWPNPLSFVLAAIVIGARQMGLAALMHDAAHRLLTADGALNDALGAWICGDPIGADLHAYRPYHLRHHRFTQQADDPDLALSAPFPTTRASLRRKILRDLTGQTALKQRTAQVLAALGAPDRPLPLRLQTFWRVFRGPILANLALASLLALCGAWWLYPLLWLLPLFTIFQLVVRIRNIAEHAMVPDNDDPLRNARTTRAGPLERLLFAPYWVNYHVEHHLLMAVPCYRLKSLHRALLAAGHGRRMETRDGYLAVLRLATSKAG
jgi:fatty acid desaturase